MRLFPILLSLTLVACAGDEDPANAPPSGGGGGGGGGGVRSDAMPSGDGGFLTISGRLCLVTDMRQPSTSCATDVVFPALTITDTTSGDEVTCAEDGSFTIRKAAQEENYALQIGFNDDSYHNVVMRLRGDSVSLTAYTLDEDDWNIFVADAGAIEAEGTATIAANVVLDDVAAAGVTFSLAEASSGVTLYDGDTATNWNQGVTGSFGVGLMFGVLSSPSAACTATREGGGISNQNVIVLPDAVTFATFDLL